jgi:hypothetical protein
MNAITMLERDHVKVKGLLARLDATTARAPVTRRSRSIRGPSKPGINITYEDVKRAVDANAMTVDATLAMIARTRDKDRGNHSAEFGAEKAHDDDGGPSVVP